MTEYQIFVQTGDIDLAGTDANVFVNLVGTDGIYLLKKINQIILNIIFTLIWKF